MEVIKSEVRKAVTMTVRLTDDECRALMEVLEELEGEISDRTYDVFKKLDNVLNELKGCEDE